MYGRPLGSLLSDITGVNLDLSNLSIPGVSASSTTVATTAPKPPTTATPSKSYMPYFLLGAGVLGLIFFMKNRR